MFHMNLLSALGRFLVIATSATLYGVNAMADLMIVGGDNKVRFDGPNILFEPPGSDAVSIVDIGTDPATPK